MPTITQIVMYQPYKLPYILLILDLLLLQALRFGLMDSFYQGGYVFSYPLFGLLDSFYQGGYV